MNEGVIHQYTHEFIVISPYNLEQVIFSMFVVPIFEFCDCIKVELVELWLRDGNHALHGDDTPVPARVILPPRLGDVAVLVVVDEDVMRLVTTVTVAHNTARQHFARFPLFF